MLGKEKEKTCDLCRNKPATILCPECPKCYCDGCSEFTHKKSPNKDHKTERIPEGVTVKAICPLHNGNPLTLLCLDDVELCCPTCMMNNPHKDHKVVKIEDIKQDNEAFSAAEVRRCFADTLERGTTLDKKIDEIIESITKEKEETKKKIEEAFEEERQKLKDEETRLLNELEEAHNKVTDQLVEFKAIMKGAREYSTVLSEAADILKMNERIERSRLMELNIVSEMEEQRRRVERLLGTEMRDLKISWDREARKLSFTRNLFNGVPRVRDVVVKAVSWSEIDLSWETDDGERNDDDEIRYTVEMRREGEKDWKEARNGLTDKKCSVGGLIDNSAYEVRVRCVAKGGALMSEWSGGVKGRTLKAPEFSECVWKECPGDVDDDKKYSVDEKNPRIATKIVNDSYCNCTVIGNTYIPLNKVTSWSVKMLKSKDNNGSGIVIGIAPSDINQNVHNSDKCGWYFHCGDSKLFSGPPHKYSSKEYGPRKGNGQYVYTGDSVGVVVDTKKGNLSFVLNGVNRGVAYEGIPLDKPLVPCVLLRCGGDSVELDLSEVKENKVDSSVPVPSNITAKSITWDSITLTWDKVAGASFYQIKVDGSKSWGATTANTFAKNGLLPETEHSFRVRTVRGSSVSEWSGGVKGRTLKAPEFPECVWKKCPDDVDERRKYSVDGNNPRIATKANSYGDCTIIGNTHIPLNTITSWSIKILKSKNNNGRGIEIGVAPSDIDQNVHNSDKCGWYFHCGDSKLFSGPPHKYSLKEYGPRKGDGEYVNTGDSVGVVMNTTKGDLSFVLNGVNLGVAYEGIPLDKPLVPCVIPYYEGDSVELDLFEVKENKVDSSVPVPSNITAKSITWDSITLVWDKVTDASFYQVEVDENKSCDVTTINTFIKRGLLPETEHIFRVRTVRGNSVSKWSGVVKGRTLKESFETSGWKECPDDVYNNRKYSVDGKNPRVATKVNSYDYCTIIGNTHISLNAVTSWNIKILKSDNGYGIYIGIAPFDINQNKNDNSDKCGWYFDCYHSTLYSGPPHKYSSKEYGPRKGNGQYVHTGDSVGVVMDTTKGELSFVLNNVNLGVAFEGIPLDKPLVPCVLLGHRGDSVELDTSEVKENEVDSSIPVPSNITSKSITWNTITLTWDEVSNASFYQIEVDGSKSWESSTANTFTRRGFLPETEHTFRVRAIAKSSVSEWSDAVKGRTPKAPKFSECVWKKCPDDVDDNMKYSVDKKNPRVATKVGDGWCTIIGNTHIPLNKVTSWSIKVLKSRDNNGGGIFIGIAQNDINQNKNDNSDKCGWYFDCYYSKLYSGPPHSYGGKEYGPRKWFTCYVHTGDSVGVVMDTTKGDLSFVLNNVNLGVAFKRIPLDIPLVPCVFLDRKGDSVELVI